MKPRAKLEVRHLFAVALLVVCSIGLVAEDTAVRTCTILTAAHDESVLFANNEDWHSPNPMIGFYPASSARYGSVHVGFRHSDGSIEFGGAMNDQGLAWDINGLPSAPLNPHPERPLAHETDNYLSTITKKAGTVAEAIEIAQEFDFGDSMALQVHIADATGDAVVVSAGADGEVAFTRKATGDGYLVSTNFNLADPDNGTKGWRYDTAVSMLEDLGAGQALTVDYAGEILDAVHLENLTSYTLYSNIFDLTNRTVHLNYMAQYGEAVHLDLEQELTKGQRVLEMQDLFAPDTVEAGQAAYRQFETRFTAVKVAAVLAILALLAGCAVLVVKRLKGRQA